jgi:two-component system sensor histidine kinase SenX3
VDVAAWLSLLVGGAIGATVAHLGARARRPAKEAAVVPHRARLFLGAVTQPIVVARPDGEVMYANPRAVELGLAQSTQRLPSAARKLAERAMTSGTRVEGDVSVQRGVGRAGVTVFAIAQPLLGERLVVITAFDLESPAAAEAARREFIVNVSHELKTPLGALRILADAVTAAADDPTQVQAFAARLADEADRLTGIVQQIIHLSRVQAAETVADPYPVDLAGVASAARDAVKTKADARGVTIRIETDSEVRVSGDAELLTMAIRNLLENAVVYSPEGGRVTVDIRSEAGEARVSVIDRGMGIGQEERSRVFERFYRTDEARTREAGGSGLGLAIVKHIARQHGGSIGLWSREGVGSTFTLRLPLASEGIGS